ncbi:hypothetical protein [Spirillospora sp. NPDC029432]|uniref:terpene synthase family protein n=1 Tax=Spirillospora sp. NPDC029432 TaxID=3154599 RepID=UPI0034542C78
MIDPHTTAPPPIAARGVPPEITVRLPPVYLPMPLQVHPRLEVLERDGVAFMTRHGLCRDAAMRARVVDSMSARLFGYACPDGDTGRLQLAVDWTYLLFLLDDEHGDQDASGGTDGDNFALLDLAVRIVRTLEAPDARVLEPGHPVSGPVLELATRLRRIADPRHRRRMADAHLHWLMGTAWEIPATVRRPRPSVNDYLLTRMMHVAHAAVLTWVQISEPDVIDDSEITSGPVRALTEMVGAVGTIDQDLYGYGRDQWIARHRPVPAVPIANMVNVYATAQNLSTDQALHATVELRDRIVHRFLRLRAEIRPAASPALRRYLDNLTTVLRGNYEFGMTAARYRNPDGRHPGAVRTTGTITDTPAATGAPGVPCIDWWWS